MESFLRALTREVQNLTQEYHADQWAVFTALVQGIAPGQYPDEAAESIIEIVTEAQQLAAYSGLPIVEALLEAARR